MPFGSLHFTFEVDGRYELDETLHGYLMRVEDWAPFFDAVAKDFSAYEAERFTKEGAFEQEDRWPDLTTAYVKAKDRAGYGDKPILQRTGAMLAAVLAPEREEEGAQMTLTINSAYAIYHDSARERQSNLPRRGIVVLSNARKTKWIKLLSKHIRGEGGT